MIELIRKRDGSFVSYDKLKIINAINKAIHAVENKFNELDSRKQSIILANEVENMLYERYDGEHMPSVEEIQDFVESILVKNNLPNVAKAFILYRDKHSKIRDTEQMILNIRSTMDGYLSQNDWRVNENSNVNYSLGGLILHNSGAITANYWLNNIYDSTIADAHINGDLHIHDLSMFSGYCAGWSLRDLLIDGLGGVAGKITSKPAKHLSTIVNQMVNFLGILQNEWAGAMAFSSFDTYLAPFVKNEKLTYHEVKQNIQSFVYGVNTPSRWGCVDVDTEVLSETGWKKHYELQEGENIYTWNDGVLGLNKVNKVVKKDFSGQMHVYTNKHGCCQQLTPEHRCIVNKFNTDKFIIKTSEEVFNTSTRYSFPAMFESSLIKGIDLSNEEIELAAMVYTDANICWRKQLDGSRVLHKIKIFKSKKRYGGERIKEILQKLNLEYTLKETNGSKSINGNKFNLNMETFVLYSDSARKVISFVQDKYKINDLFLKMNKEQAILFLTAWAKFDGKGSRLTLQCDNEIIEKQIQHIAILAGYTSYYKIKKKSNYIKLHRVKTMNFKIRTKIDYNGLVWCPNTDAGTAIFRKNKSVFISGNSQSPFTNITLDWIVPKDLKDQPAIIGGQPQDFTYADCQKEMDMINKAFLDVFLEGDADGRGFSYPIPTYNITEDFDWDSENAKLLFEMTGKYGTPYFQNFISSDLDPSQVRSMCCRLRLDKREINARYDKLTQKGGGLFGAAELTGSIGVVTINLGRIGYLATSKEDYYARLNNLMDIARNSLETKRKVVTKLLETGLFPYSKRYLKHGFNNHFSTIGLIGMNESLLNFMNKDMLDEEARSFTKEVLLHMRERLVQYQHETNNLYNLEATPGEGTSYRLAKVDRKKYPEMKLSGSNEYPYYTNSTQLPVDSTSDIFEALDMQNDLQIQYTGGTVLHGFIGSSIDPEICKSLVKKIAYNYQIPYFTITPTFSICQDHGYLKGEQYICPKCQKETEVYSRIVGYYRPLQNWNHGKKVEFSRRREYIVGDKITNEKVVV